MQRHLRAAMIATITVCILFMAATVGNVQAAPKAATAPDITAKHAFLLDTTSWHVLFEKKGITDEVQIASITKVMTAILVLKYANLDQVVTIQQKYVDYVIENGASNAGLVAGERFTVRDLMYALMLPSGCDAAYALAETVAGSYDGFVALMNQQAAQMGLTHTHFTSVDGLHLKDSSGKYGYSTAEEVVRMGTYGMFMSLFKTVVGTVSYDVAATADHQAHTWNNTNQLLVNYEGAIGIKTGTTPWAGPCVLFAATRNGHTLIGVALNSADVNQRFVDAAAMLDWGFQQIANGSDVQSQQVAPVTV